MADTPRTPTVGSALLSFIAPSLRLGHVSKPGTTRKRGGGVFSFSCDVTAATGNSSDVQAAITAASSGQTVCIPAGSWTWTTPVTTLYSGGSPVYSGAGTSKYVKIVGAGSLPTHGAATSGGTTITDHVTQVDPQTGPYFSLFFLVEAAAGNVELANITVNLVDSYPKFSVIGWERGPVSVGTTGAKVLVMHHMTFNDSRTEGVESQISRVPSSRGLWYRNKFLRSPSFSNYATWRCLVPGSGSFWRSAHTFGTADTGGDMNFYFEDNIVENYPETSTDSGCRTITRFNELTNFSLTGHGLDSQSPGASLEESYGNNFNCSGSSSVMGSPVALRGASQRHHNNRFDVFDLRCTSSSNSGHITTGVYIIRDRPGTSCYRKSDGTPGTYPAPHQFGWGWTSGATTVDRWYFDQASPSTHVAQDPDGPYHQDLQPSYVWNNYLKDGTTKIYDGATNSGGFQLVDHDPDSCNSGQSSSDFIVENREWYKQNDSFTGAAGIGIGPRSSRPSTCTVGTAWWATDQGSAKTSTTTNLTVQGVLDICTGTNTWTNGSYSVSYPHQLHTVTGS